ncbi:hypothetical protein GQ457_10G012370 [Hibiscus cannabinus]
MLFGGWFHYHKAAPKLAWFQDVESMLNHHLAGLLGLGSLSWAGSAHFLLEACDLLFDAKSKGKQLLIVGTKNKAIDSVTWAAIRARCHYVNKKWLGGMLTNWPTTETRLHKFMDLRTE